MKKKDLLSIFKHSQKNSVSTTPISRRLDILTSRGFAGTMKKSS
jgi:hypothetical protein